MEGIKDPEIKKGGGSEVPGPSVSSEEGDNLSKNKLGSDGRSCATHHLVRNRDEFSTRLSEAIALYNNKSSMSLSSKKKSMVSQRQEVEQSAARCVPVQDSMAYSCLQNERHDDEVESPEDIATFKVNSLKLLDRVAELYAKEEERTKMLKTEVSNLRGSLIAKDREMESLKEELSVKTAREGVLDQENQRLKRQLEMLLRIGPTRHRELMSASGGGRDLRDGWPKMSLLPPPPLVKPIGQDKSNRNQGGGFQIRPYSSLALRRFGRVSDSPPKLLPAVNLRRRPASAGGNLSLEWNGVGGMNDNDDEDVSSPDENEDEEEIVENSSSGNEFEEDEEDDIVASTTSGIHEDSRYLVNGSSNEKSPGRRVPRGRGRPRKKQTWPAHYSTHPMLQVTCKNLSRTPRPSPPPEVTSSEDKDISGRRKRKKPLQEIVDSQAKRSNSSQEIQLAPVPRRKSSTSAPKSLISANDLEQCMTTRIPYRISMMEDRMNELLKAQEAEESRSEGNVEVPAWRIKVYEPIFDPTPYPEIEDVSEAVVHKRHQRLEIDEKRRKRWDSQRAREETYLDRLKRRIDEREKQKVQRRKAAAGRKLNSDRQATSGVGADGDRGGKTKGSSGNGDGGSDDEMSSVHPRPEDIRFIRVSDDLPISMFGVPLPIVPPRKFDIPWRPNRLLVTQKNGLCAITAPSDNDSKISSPMVNGDIFPPSPPVSSPIVNLPSPPDPADEDNCPDFAEDSSSSSVSSLLSLPSPTTEVHLVNHNLLGDPIRNSSPPSECVPKDPFDFDDDQDMEDGINRTLLRCGDSKSADSEKVTSSVSSPAPDKPEADKVFVFHSPTR